MYVKMGTAMIVKIRNKAIFHIVSSFFGAQFSKLLWLKINYWEFDGVFE
jgi:hypothetical protein